MARWAWGQNFVNAIIGNLAGPNSADNPIIVSQAAGGASQTVNQGTGNGGSSPWAVQGGVAAAVADSGNPVKIGGVYLSSLPTLTNGQRGNAQLDVNGRLIVTEGTLLSGESQTLNRLLTALGYTAATAAAVATTVIKSGAGVCGGIIVPTLVAGGTVKIYANTAASGDVLLDTWTVPATITTGMGAHFIPVPANFTLGLTVVMTGTAMVATVYYL